MPHAKGLSCIGLDSCRLPDFDVRQHLPGGFQFAVDHGDVFLQHVIHALSREGEPSSSSSSVGHVCGVYF